VISGPRPAAWEPANGPGVSGPAVAYAKERSPSNSPSVRHSLVSMDYGTDRTAALTRGLAGYLQAVADAVGVPADATSFEISDTATAYLGLMWRWPGRPGDDLMLIWSEREGWAVAVETIPGEAPMVVAYFAGADVVPAPMVVARFVTDVVAGRRSGSPQPVFPSERRELAGRLAGYA